MFECIVIVPESECIILRELGVSYEDAVLNASVSAEKEGWNLKELEFEVEQLSY